MPEEVLKNIYRLPIPLPGNPLKELNAYLIKGKDRNLLIDTGFRQEACRRALFSELAELGLRPGEVDVLATHLHADHTGLTPDVAGEKGTVYISRPDARIFDPKEDKTVYWKGVERSFMNEGFPEDLVIRIWDSNPAHSMSPPNNVPHVCLEDGDVLEAGGYRLRCLLMPGHTLGQMCFWMEEQGAMFLGDHVLFDITPNITAWPDMSDALGAYLDSLDRIRAYAPVRALPGHRGPGELAERVDQLKEHHRRRLEEALKAVREHPGAGAYELAGHMTWKIRARSWADFPVAQKWFAVGECMSHLDRLIAEGRVACRVEGGRNRYQAV